MGPVPLIVDRRSRVWIRRGTRLSLPLSLLGALSFGPARAQAQAPPAGSFQLPPVIVTAQKETADLKNVPVSVSAVPERVLRDAGAAIVSDVALLSPNTFFSEFSARKLSNVRFRGIGSSPANPAVTTTLDGVPQ